jgi:hypothetical protein
LVRGTGTATGATGGDLIGAGTLPSILPSNMPAWSIWDRFPRSALMSVCYYPARLGQTGLGQFVEGDNTAYTTGTTWMAPQTGKTFNDYITDTRLPATPTPYNAGSFILIGAGIDGLYGTLDDVRNYGT